jgi:hypothetical protein
VGADSSFFGRCKNFLLVGIESNFKLLRPKIIPIMKTKGYGLNETKRKGSTTTPFFWTRLPVQNSLVPATFFVG